ncbi:MAG: hypothetical protein HS127_07775 [Planctomycetia bacterium]|nr:hypothetical protein [Planctomycetia bacterium]
MTELRGTDDLLGCMSVACYSVPTAISQRSTDNVLCWRWINRLSKTSLVNAFEHTSRRKRVIHMTGEDLRLGQNSLTARYKEIPKSELYEMVIDKLLSQVYL